ncbi:MAG: ABC transporter ATP-binding protein [Ignavibacteria bacterium]|nr:ABC transporter ATP-binding protein [Ignavibacteria bacterium]
MTPEFAVSARELRRNFGAFTAVDGISFDVRHGEIFGFLGANGAGKTTAIRMLCGLLPPTSGSATVAGYDIGRQVHQVKGAIGYMSQRFSLYDDISVGENIEFYGGVYGLSRAAIAAKSKSLLADLGLSDQRHLLTKSLPLGWKQRLALGTALLHEPSIIFLDEPTGGVDPISRRRFWRIIYELAEKGTTVFVTTHYMDEAEYCNRISIMHQGAIVALGSPTALKQEYGLGTVQDVFVHLITGTTDR